MPVADKKLRSAMLLSFFVLVAGGLDRWERRGVRREKSRLLLSYDLSRFSARLGKIQ